jgi:hypothetical protein
MFAFLAGLAAGLLHVFSGPDHLAAVAPLAAEGRRGQWRTGLEWGIGHTTGVVLIALLLLWIRQRLPLDAISAYSERLVGLALIAVGAWGIRGAWRRRSYGAAGSGHAHAGASFAIGTVHGLAGSSHLFGVLPALAFSAQLDSMLYLAGFGIGAMAGMTAFAAGVGLIAIRFGSDHRRYRGLLYASSAAALVIGGFWLVGR